MKNDTAQDTAVCRHVAPGIRLRVLSKLAHDLAHSFSPASLELLSNQAPFKKIAKTLKNIAVDLSNGTKAAPAFCKHQALFGSFFCSVISRGEAAGNLSRLLASTAGYFNDEERFRKKIYGKLRSPLFVLAGAMGILVALLSAFIPVAVHKVVSSVNVPVPGVTEFVLSALLVIAHYWLAAAALIIIASVLMVRFRWLPFAGRVKRKNSLRRFSSALHLFSSSGIGLSKALELAAETFGSSIERQNIIQTARENGDDIGSCSKACSKALKAAGIFPPFIIEIQSMEEKKADRNAPRGAPYKRTAEFYEEEIDAAVSVFAILLPPVALTLFGLFGTGILAALYLPFLQIVGNH